MLTARDYPQRPADYRHRHRRVTSRVLELECVLDLHSVQPRSSGSHYQQVAVDPGQRRRSLLRHHPRIRRPHARQSNQHQSATVSEVRIYLCTYSVSKKSWSFSDIFPKRLGIFTPNFTHLFYYTFLSTLDYKFFIQSSPTVISYVLVNAKKAYVPAI